MNRLLIPSDRLKLQSDECNEALCNRTAETPTRTRARLAANRASAARLVERDLQTLRAAQLSLRRRSRPWAQALLVHQPAGSTSLERICAQRNSCANSRVHKQFSEAAGDAGRDFSDQCRASSATSGFGVGGDGSGACRTRFRQGRSNPCGHGGVLSRRQRAGSKFGGVQ